MENLTDKQIYEYIKEFFAVEELVSPGVFKKYGERSWRFLCPRLLHTLLIIRVKLDKSITINNWKWGGQFDERGLRDNLTPIFNGKTKAGKMYLSGHILGRAIDFDVKGMTAPEVREWLVLNADILPYKIRLENKLNGKQISWVHLDMIYEERNPKAYLFNI